MRPSYNPYVIHISYQQFKYFQYGNEPDIMIYSGLYYKNILRIAEGVMQDGRTTANSHPS